MHMTNFESHITFDGNDRKSKDDYVNIWQFCGAYYKFNGLRDLLNQFSELRGKLYLKQRQNDNLHC